MGTTIRLWRYKVIDNVMAALRNVTAERIIAILTVICILAMLCNRKINFAVVFVEQLRVFKDNRTKKVSPWDIVSFILCPIFLSLVLVIWYDFSINKELAQILTTAFSLIFTLLLAFETIIVSKKNSTNDIEREVIGQTFVSAVSASIFALVGIILSIMIVFVSGVFARRVFTALILILSFMTIMFLLMIIKRTFKIFMNDSKE